jgi:hypothetical protein
MTPHGRAVTPFESLAPDQRAAVELVLRQGRSFGALADLLRIPEPAVRARAHSALEALAPDLAPPPEAARVADWLLGQQHPAEAARTRALLARDAATRRWAETVAAPLRELAWDRVPGLPPVEVELPPSRAHAAARRGTKPGGATPPPRRPLREPGASEPDGAMSPPRPPRSEPDASEPDGAASAPGRPLREPAAAPARGRSSRLGGAILIGALVVVLGGVLAFVLTRGGGDEPSSSPAPAATATAAATPQQTGNDIVLRGPAGSQAAGIIRLFKSQNGDVQFGLAAQGVPPNTGKQVYAIWFAKRNGQARRLGFAQTQVGKDGVLTTGGPQSKDLKRFPGWFATYDSVLVTRETKPNAKHPGSVVLRGTLPHGAG